MEKWSDEAFGGYLAAMIDGEGHIEVGKTSMLVRIRIANTIKPTLDAIVARLGFGRVIEYARPKDKNFKRLFCVEVSNAKHVKEVFAICGAWIHMKRDQMDRALFVANAITEEVSRIDTRNRAILAEIKKGTVQRKIAKDFGVSEQLISRIKSGHTWGSVLRGHQARALKKRFKWGADQSFRLHGEPSGK